MPFSAPGVSQHGASVPTAPFPALPFSQPMPIVALPGFPIFGFVKPWHSRAGVFNVSFGEWEKIPRL